MRAVLFEVALVLALASCGAPSTGIPDAGVNGGEDAGAWEEDGGKPGEDGGVPCLPVSGSGTPLITGVASARRLAADDTFLYVGTTGSPGSTDGRVIRIPLAGGSAAEVARGLRSPDALVADGERLFVLDDAGLWRVDLASGAKTRIDTTLNNALYGESALLLDGSAVLEVTGFRAVVRVEQDGSSTRVLYQAPAGAAVHGLAMLEGELYFLVVSGTEPGIWRVRADGSSPAVRVRAEPQNGHALIIDGDHFTWSEGEGGSGRIVTAPMAGGEATVLADGLSHPFQLLRFKGALYFKDTTSSATADFLRAVGGCGLAPVGPSGFGPGDLIEAGGVLFFSSEDSSPQGYVSRLP